MPTTQTPGLLLLGHFAEREGVNFLSQLCVCSDTRPHALKALWYEAHRKRGNSVANAGKPAIRPVPPELEGYAAAVCSLPRLAAGIDGMAIEVKMIEHERLAAYQAGVFLPRVEAIEKVLGSSPTGREVAEVCLPLSNQLNVADLSFPVGSPLRFVTRNANARVVGAGHGDLNPDTGMLPMVFLIAESEPCIQVIEFKGRWYLRNGYHRLVAASRCGVREIPALVMHARRWEDVNADLGVGWFFDPRKVGDLPTVGQLASAPQIAYRSFETVTEFSWKVQTRPI